MIKTTPSINKACATQLGTMGWLQCHFLKLQSILLQSSKCYTSKKLGNFELLPKLRATQTPPPMKINATPVIRYEDSHPLSHNLYLYSYMSSIIRSFIKTIPFTVQQVAFHLVINVQ